MYLNTEENKKVWVEKVERILRIGGRSYKTFVNYKVHIKRFLNYYDNDTDFCNIKEEDILDFIEINYLKLNRTSASTNVAICSIKFLYSVCFKINLNRKLIPNIKMVQALPSLISKKDFINIINNTDNLKHKCWLLLAFCSGLRSSEVVSVRIEDINAEEHKIKVLGKRKKERYTVLPDITIKFLRLYCKYNNITKKTGYLFVNNQGKPNSSATVTEMFMFIKQRYNIPDNITFHSLRHSFATYFLTNGGDLLALQALLGHKDLNTTRRYIHFSKNYNHLNGINYVE